MGGIQDHILQAVEAFIDTFGVFDASRFKSLYVGHFRTWDDFIRRCLVDDFESGVIVEPVNMEAYKQELNADYVDKDGFIFLKH